MESRSEVLASQEHLTEFLTRKPFTVYISRMASIGMRRCFEYAASYHAERPLRDDFSI